VPVGSFERFAEPLHLEGRSAGAGSRLDPAALAVLRHQIDLLLDGTEDGVFGVDRDGRATLVTPSVAAMTGHAVEELVGRGMHEVLHHSHANGEDYPREHCPIYAAFKDGKVHRAEEVFWRKDGSSFPIEYTSTPLVRGGDVVGAVVVFRELGQRREARERIRRMLDQLGPTGAAAGRAEALSPVGASPAWHAAMELVRRLAPVDTTVMLLGESGTGKELVARAIHERGPRRGRPLVKLNCAAIPGSLIESELFGHERGAFTGAVAQRIGRFEQADDGTLFLDEVGELSLEAQAKLLRVLQEREFERVGGTRTIPSRARVIAATNQDLSALVAAGRFRADLYYRLSVFPMRLPPLRERREDIPLLVNHFLARLGPRLGRTLPGFTRQAQQRLLAHDWPGNVRELENVVERAALLSDGGLLEAPFAPVETPGPAPSAGERDTLVRALQAAGWRVTGPRGAAAALAIHPNTLRYRMRRLGIRRPSA
jgi:PAS domain S-box-containing protein